MVQRGPYNIEVLPITKMYRNPKLHSNITCTNNDQQSVFRIQNYLIYTEKPRRFLFNIQ